MQSFLGAKLATWPIPASLVWLLTEVAEAKGRQGLFTHQSPQVLSALRTTALIQSTESSNRIEGVTVSHDRLAPLVLGKAKPRDRSEAEIEGYRKGLNLIHTRAASLTINPETCQRLHALLTAGTGDAGQWKRVDNEITEVQANAPPRVRFVPVSARETPKTMEALCRSYRHALDQERVAGPVAIAAFVLDFLCIHPFRDGNGRVSRLLTLLALYQHGFEVGRYVSLERLVEEDTEAYYSALEQSSKGWHESRHDLAPWAIFFTSILRRAYVELEARAGEITKVRGAKTAQVKAVMEALPDEFTIADLRLAAPGASLDLIRKVLKREQQAGRLKCLQRGRNARWKRIGY